MMGFGKWGQNGIRKPLPAENFLAVLDSSDIHHSW